jgi:hypothetical protein
MFNNRVFVNINHDNNLPIARTVTVEELNRRINSANNTLAPEPAESITPCPKKISITMDGITTVVDNENNGKIASYINTSSINNTGNDIIFEEPKNDECEYSTIKYMLINKAIDIRSAADMIVAQIAHNTIHLAYGDNDAVEFMQDSWDELNKHLFDNIRSLVSIHLDTFMRYENLNSSKRHYFSIKSFVKKMIILANEYYGYKFRWEDFESEIDMIYYFFK